MAAQESRFCHSNVYKWKDSAGRDTFFNAKEHFRAMVNAAPCDAPIPDPDIYIDNVDWNSKIDPRLMSDLDKEYFDDADDSVPNPTGGRNEMNTGNDKSM